MNGYRVEWLDRSGRLWWLNRPARQGGVRLVDEGIEGLVGVVEDQAVAAVGVPGQVLDSQLVEAMTGSLTVLVTRTQSESVDDLIAAFRAGWSTAPHGAGTLSIFSPRLGRLSARVRSSESIPALGRNSSAKAVHQMTVPVVADRGLWATAGLSDVGEVEVPNMGDAPIYPTIWWDGAGGDVVLPSGAVITLPPVDGERIVYLDPSQSGAVTFPDGQLDRALWRQIRATVLPEGVPTAQTRVFTLPAGASLHWIQEVADPWR